MRKLLFSMLTLKHSLRAVRHRLIHTIYALSSGFGKCGVAVIRISGPDARIALVKMCKRLPPPRTAVLNRIKDPETDEFLDHGLILWFPGPASFTGEDSCEFQVHGGPAVLASIFSSLAKLTNFRPAEPGEFTRRAFYRGKLDLTAVEGLADLINAETEFQRKQAVIQMDGALYQQYSAWRTTLSRCLANIEAYIDFEEDQNIESSVLSDARKTVQDLRNVIKTHLNDGRKGERLRSGVGLTIVGAPNVGKSSILNLLSRKPTAIVSDIPGTTRDVIQVDLDIGGFPVNLRDTAGLRKGTSDIVELEGMKRARAAFEQTDLSMVVVDALEINNDDAYACLVSHIHSLGVALDSWDDSQAVQKSKKCLIVVNKVDLVDEEQHLLALKKKFGGSLCLLSCKTEVGLEDLVTSLTSYLAELCGNPTLDNPAFSQQRHRYCIEEVLAALDKFACYSDLEVDLACQDVRNALYSLGKITGHVSTEEILDIIFKEFCIGK